MGQEIGSNSPEHGNRDLEWAGSGLGCAVPAEGEKPDGHLRRGPLNARRPSCVTWGRMCQEGLLE